MPQCITCQHFTKLTNAKAAKSRLTNSDLLFTCTQGHYHQSQGHKIPRKALQSDSSWNDPCKNWKKNERKQLP